MKTNIRAAASAAFAVTATMAARAVTAAMAAIAAMAAASSAVAAGFNGPLAPANFTTVNTGVLSGGSPVAGTASFTATQLTLVGSDSISPNPASYAPGCTGGLYGTLSSPCELRSVVSFAGTVTFNWSYTTADAAGPAGDIFGVIVDGTRIALSSPGGAPAQSGVRSFTSASSFGWFVNCTDCITGAATAVISNVNAVPEPGSVALWLGGLAGVGGVVRWRSARGGRAV